LRASIYGGILYFIVLHRKSKYIKVNFVTFVENEFPIPYKTLNQSHNVQRLGAASQKPTVSVATSIDVHNWQSACWNLMLAARI